MIAFEVANFMIEIEIICIDRHVLRVFERNNEYIVERYLYDCKTGRPYPVNVVRIQDPRYVDWAIRYMLELCNRLQLLRP